LKFIINCIVLLFCLIGNIYSQNIIKGIIVNEKQLPLTGVSIILHPRLSSKIISFAISNTEGRFKFEYFAENNDTLELTASLLGYIKQSMLFLPGQKLDFFIVLDSGKVLLPEVKIKPLPVWQRKDTINYNVSEFKQPQDRVIGDIIARLPGIEISAQGQIKYNGRPINRYYIEGLDLLEDRYGIANNNIPVESVDKIQVLENHQPIRVLDSVSFTDRAALNIKLKPNAKMKLIKKAKLGIGVSPLLNEDEAIGMLFKKKLQFINTYKYNNSGLDIIQELNSQNINEYINAVQNGAIKSDMVSLIKPNAPPVSKNRYLFNNTHVASINQLLPLDSIYQLRINLSYINDFQKQLSNTITKFYLPDDTIAVAEQNKYQSNMNILQSDISLIANIQNYYLKNSFKFQGWWSEEKSSVTSNNIINQELNNPFFNFSNDFKFLKTKKKLIKEIGSYFGYVTTPQNLYVLPGLYSDILNNNLPYDELLQAASLRNFYSNNFVSVSKKKSKTSAQYKLGFNIQSQHLLTGLFTRTIMSTAHLVADTFQNNLNWSRYRIYSENNWSYETNKFRFGFSLPINFTQINYKDILLNVNSKEKRAFASPVITLMFQLSPNWSISTSASCDENFGDISGITRGYILKTYRNLYNNNSPLQETKYRSISILLTFKNLLKTIFFNTGISISKNKLNFLYNQQFNGYLETLTAFLQDNYKNNIDISGRLSKYIIDWKTSINFNSNYNFGNQQQLQQDKLSTFSNKNFSIGGNISTKITTSITADYAANYFKYSSKSQFQDFSRFINSMKQSISLSYYPTQWFLFSIAEEHYYTHNSVALTKNYFFSDINARYKPKMGKIDYTLFCQNLFNTKSFTNALLLNNTETVSYLQLRPRQLFLKASFFF
jgi:hypothetical protein